MKIKTQYKQTKICELLEQTVGGTWGPESDETNGVPVLRSTNFTKDQKIVFENIAYRDITEAKLTNRVLNNGDFLIEISGGGPSQPVGRALEFINPDGKTYTYSNFVRRLKLNSDLLTQEYLSLALKALYIFGETEPIQTNTTNLRNLNFKDYINLEIPVPTIQEQKQIVAKIKECFTLLDKSEAKLKQAEAKLSSVINSSNKLFKTKTSNITYKLSEVFKLRNGKFNPSSNLKNNFDTEFKFKVYGGNGITGYFNKALVQGQTIIIGRVGAKCGSIHKSKEPVWVTDNALYIETFLNEVDLEFLYWKLISLNLNGLSDGTGQPKIDQSKIYSLTIDIPDTIEEQKRIARQFEITNERVNNSLAQIQRSKSAVQNIRQSILKKAFEGKLI